MVPGRPGRPQVVAHRGSSATNAEHTLGAYIAALDEGADALECDVRLTADGHLVCVHDRDLRRTAYTDGLVSTMDLAELEELDFARWKNPWADLDDELPETDRELSAVLTLRRLLETVADYPGKVGLAIETKHPTRFSGLVERRLVEVLDEFGWAGAGSPVRVMSFSLVALRRVRRLSEHLDLVFLMDRPTQWARSRPVALPGWIGGPDIMLLHRQPALIRRIKKTGTPLHVWTVNSETDVELCLEHEVEAIITDKPAIVRRYLDGEFRD